MQLLMEEQFNEIIQESSQMRLSKLCEKISHQLVQLITFYMNQGDDDSLLIAASLLRFDQMVECLRFLLERQDQLQTSNQKKTLVDVYQVLSEMQADLFEACMLRNDFDRQLREIVLDLSTLSFFFVKYLFSS